MRKNLIIDFRMHSSSGIGTYVKNLVPFFIYIFDITLLGDVEEIKKYRWSNKVKIIECISKIYSIKEQLELFRKIQQCDLFWSPHYNIPIFPIKAKYRMVTIHDVYHLAFQNTLPLHQRMYAKFMINRALKMSDIILTVSEFSKKEILKYTATSKNIEVVYNGIEQDWIVNKPLPPSKRDNYILFVGNVKPHKNLVRALKAFSLLKYPNLKLKIVGKKEGFITSDKEVEKIAKKLGNRVEFTGYVSDKQLRKLYMEASLFVFPSIYEGFGLPPLEAMACGTPVIVSNVSSLPEVCGDAAYYVNPYDIDDIAKGIKTVLDNKQLQQQLIKKGLERVKLFSWKKSAEKLAEIIQRTVQE